MPQRALWAAALVAAALADSAGLSQLGFYLVLIAIAGGATVALRAVAELVDEEGALLAVRAVLSGCALAFVVAAAAVRAPFVAEGAVPQASSTALIAALALLGVDLLLAPLRRLGGEPVAERA